jgi:hypothetical protein
MQNRPVMIKAIVYVVTSAILIAVLALGLAWALNWSRLANRAAAFYRRHPIYPAALYESPTYYRVFGSVLALGSLTGLVFWIPYLLTAPAPTCRHVAPPTVNATVAVFPTTGSAPITIKVGDTIFADFECTGVPLTAPATNQAGVLVTVFTRTASGNGYAEFRAVAPGQRVIESSADQPIPPGAMPPGGPGVLVTVEPAG